MDHTLAQSFCQRMFNIYRLLCSNGSSSQELPCPAAGLALAATKSEFLCFDTKVANCHSALTASFAAEGAAVTRPPFLAADLALDATKVELLCFETKVANCHSAPTAFFAAEGAAVTTACPAAGPCTSCNRLGRLIKLDTKAADPVHLLLPLQRWEQQPPSQGLCCPDSASPWGHWNLASSSGSTATATQCWQQPGFS
jgi:hypothetical protein